MTERIEYIRYPIVLENFDWIYYVKNNLDIKDLGLTNQIQCFQHWKTTGCYQGKKVRNLKNDNILSIKLNSNQQFTHKLHHEQINIPTFNTNPIELIKPKIVIHHPQPKSKPIPVQVNKIPKLIEKSIEKEVKPKTDKIILPKYIPLKSIPQPRIPISRPPILRTSELKKPQIEITYVGSKIKLNKPIAVLIHIFDPIYISFFVKNINFLHTKYTSDSIHVYINIVEEDNPTYKGTELRNYINNQCSQIDNGIRIEIFYNENRGGDIGGFLILCQKINPELYNNIIFVHSKTKMKWKYELCSTIFNYPLHLLNDSIGIVGNNKWTRTVNLNDKKSDIQKFVPHFDKLFKYYDIDQKTVGSWKFIAGTMFILNIKIVNYIINHNINEVYMMLNKLQSVDENWINMIKEMKLDNRGCGNDLQYRVKFGQSLHADYMIEHAYERLIGLICHLLNLKILS